MERIRRRPTLGFGARSSQRPSGIEVHGREDHHVGRDDEHRVDEAEANVESGVVGSHGGVQRAGQADVDPENVVVRERQKEDPDRQSRKRRKHSYRPRAGDGLMARKSRNGRSRVADVAKNHDGDLSTLFVESRASVKTSPKASPARRSLSRRRAIDLELRAA